MFVIQQKCEKEYEYTISVFKAELDFKVSVVYI